MKEIKIKHNEFSSIGVNLKEKELEIRYLNGYVYQYVCDNISCYYKLNCKNNKETIIFADVKHVFLK